MATTRLTREDRCTLEGGGGENWGKHNLILDLTTPFRNSPCEDYQPVFAPAAEK